MPLARFENLPEERRDEIIHAAAKSFATQGFQGASLNQLLSDIEMSKGSFYYYFLDKADLFSAVLRRYFKLEILIEVEVLAACTTADEFWQAIADSSHRSMRILLEEPLSIPLAQALAQLDTDDLATGPVGEYVREFTESLMNCIERGQQVGAVRADVPPAILTQLWMTADQILSAWILSEWEGASAARQRELLQIALEMYRGLLSPPRSS